MDLRASLMRVVFFAALTSPATANSLPGMAAFGAIEPTPSVIPPATIDDQLQVTGDAIAAKEVRTRLSIPVMVNGRGPFRFVVDSGADRSVIGLALAERLGLPPAKPVTLLSMAGASRVETVKLETLGVGSTTISNIAAPTLSELHLGAQGMLGIDALADQRLMLDFEQKTITVQDASVPPPVARGNSNEIVVVARRRRGQLIITGASVGNQRVQAIVDTGAELTIGNSALRERLFRGRTPPAERPVTLTSVTGQPIEASLVTLPDIEIGGLLLRGVTIAFADVPPFKLFGLDKTPALLLGTDVLEVFSRVSLDFERRRVRFELKRPRQSRG